MPEPVINQSRFQDRLTIGTAGKGGVLSISFDSADYNESVRRVDVAIQVRDHLLERLAGGGAKI
jgi:hypothetical protein